MPLDDDDGWNVHRHSLYFAAPTLCSEARILAEKYGQVCAQKFPHPRAFDGMPARASRRHPTLNSPFWVLLLHYSIVRNVFILYLLALWWLNSHQQRVNHVSWDSWACGARARHSTDWIFARRVCDWRPPVSRICISSLLWYIKRRPLYMPCAHYSLNCVCILSKLQAFKMYDRVHLMEILTLLYFKQTSFIVP